MTQLQELERIRSITSDNHLEIMKKMLGAFHELDSRTIKLADWAGSQDMSLMNALTELKTEQQETNLRLSRLETKLETGQQETNQRLDQTNQSLDQTNQRLDQTNQRLAQLETGQQQLQQELRQTREETVELLRMIADNTRR